MNKRQFIKLGVHGAVVAALCLGLGAPQVLAQNRTAFEKNKLFRGFQNTDDEIFQGFAYHAFHNGRAPRIVHPEGGYTFFLDSFVGNGGIPLSARVSEFTPRIEPGYWLVAVKLDEIYNTGIDIQRFRGLRLDVFNYAVELHASGDLEKLTDLSPEMRHFIWGVKAFMDKYSTTSRHSDRQGIRDEDIERHFMASIYFAAYRHKEKTEEQINLAVDNFMRASTLQRQAMASEVFEALAQLGPGDSKSIDPDDAYNRHYVATWSSYIIGTKIAVFLGDIEKSLLLETTIETPLRRFVPGVRPDSERREPVLKI
jgi:hypothetical protein